MNINDQILTLDASAADLKVCKMTLLRWIEQGRAPEPMRLGLGKVKAALLVYYRADIEELKRARAAGLL